MVISLAAGLFVLYQFSTLVLFAAIALVISHILDPMVNRMQASGIHRLVSILIVMSGLFLILYYLSTSILPPIIEQVVHLGRQVNEENIRLIATTIDTWIVDNIPFVPQGFIAKSVTQLIDQLFQFGDVQNAITRIFSNLFGLVGNVFTAVIVIPLTIFFLLKDGSKLRRHVLLLVPNRYFETTLSILYKTEKRLGIYFKSVALQSAIVAVLSSTLLSIIGMNNAIIVGICLGALNTIPYFGPALGYLLVVLVAIFETGDLSLVYPALLCTLTTQLVDNIVLQPAIFSKSADMHPLAILFIVFVGAEIGGVLGMLIAIPIAATINLTIKEIIWSFNNYQIFRLNK